MAREMRWQAKLSGFVSRWKQFHSLKNYRTVRICSVLNRSNRNTTVYYRLIFCAFSWPNMVKWNHIGIINICGRPANNKGTQEYSRYSRVLKVHKTEGTVFPNKDRPRPANNVFIIFFRRGLCKQFLCWIFTAAIFNWCTRAFEI